MLDVNKMTMKKKATLFVAKGCPFCAEAKKEIAKRKKAGTLCYDFKCVDVDKSPKIAKSKNIKAVPMVEVDGKLQTFEEVLKRINPKLNN